jgi:hypothetical protein
MSKPAKHPKHPLSRYLTEWRVPWMRALKDNPATPDKKAHYSPNPIELDANGNPVGKAELYQRMVRELADPYCTGLRAVELQRIWIRLPGHGLRSWGHIVTDAKALAESRPKDYWYTFTIESESTESAKESYVVVWKQWAGDVKPREYVCTVYIPAHGGEEPHEAIAIAKTIVEALNRVEQVEPQL